MNTLSTDPTIAHRRSIATWLFTCCGLVFVMVIVGAITRLTESGLSMVEWRPLIGALPPLNEAEWVRVFELYKQTPEFINKNAWMTLDDFKNIFFWEWFHRLLGRLIGIAYGLPLLWFAIKRQIPRGFGLPLTGLLILGGLQGYMGWYMVQSGLVDQPAVSHYRLAAHLGLAFLIFALLLKTGLHILKTPKITLPRGLHVHLWVGLISLILTIFWGAYTAGLDAGLVYNDGFPKMGGAWLPPEPMPYSPLIINFLENHAHVQFSHRWLAILTTLIITSYWFHAKWRGTTNWAINALGIMVLIQFSLGIITLMTHVALPVATLHQGGALITLGLIVLNFYDVGKEKKQSA